MSEIVNVKFAESGTDICVSVAPGFNDEIPVEFASECSGGIHVKFDDIGRNGKNGVSPIIKNGTWWTWDDENDEFVDTGVAASGGTGGGYIIGHGLKLEGMVLSVDSAVSVEKDNTLPITSAAVYTEIGNIDALLQTI